MYAEYNVFAQYRGPPLNCEIDHNTILSFKEIVL